MFSGLFFTTWEMSGAHMYATDLSGELFTQLIFNQTLRHIWMEYWLQLINFYGIVLVGCSTEKSAE